MTVAASAETPSHVFAERAWEQFLEHPVFHGEEYSSFFQVIPMFWRGELYWHGEPMSHPVQDWVYTISTLVLFAVSAVALTRKWGEPAAAERRVVARCLLLVGASFGLVAALWIYYNHFFLFARLVLVALVPFFLLYLDGLDRFCSRFEQPWLFWWIVAVLLSGTWVWEIHYGADIFGSAFNWFHVS